MKSTFFNLFVLVTLLGGIDAAPAFSPALPSIGEHLEHIRSSPYQTSIRQQLTQQHPKPVETVEKRAIDHHDDLASYLQALQAALHQQGAFLLSNYTNQEMHISFEYGVLFNEWETWEVDAFLRQWTAWDDGHSVQLQLMNDAPLWYLNNLNPYIDMLQDKQVVAVLSATNLSNNSDSEALIFITVDENGRYVWDSTIYTSVGFERTNTGYEITNRSFHYTVYCAAPF